MSARFGVLFVALSLTVTGLADAEAQERGSGMTPLGTPELRAELFDSIMEMTRRREAWSPFKEEGMGYDPLAEMEAVRDQVVNAGTEEELYYALTLLSNARRDSHLYLTPVPDGLSGPRLPEVHAP
ncbi:MAG: hypothetical protein ACPHO4_14625, partial [Longimicrobiales bacterium]